MDNPHKNNLDKAQSAYLRQHKDNPVHWQPWGAAAFARAAAENKPVLLSVGYAACHWCHVMAHESFENPAIAQLMNKHYICIKLDREERPDLDSLYQQALGLMGRQGGWPLTMFLDAGGKPFWGGTYFPPLPRHGLPGFVDVLQGIAASYLQEPDVITHNTASLTTALRERLNPPAAPAITPEIIARAAAHILSDIDPQHGGLGSAPKFPQLTRLRLLWDHGLRTGDERACDAVLQSLIDICHSGLFDHIGGGFFRYCTDAAWQVPHFEKMLDDQAMFIALLADITSLHPHPQLLRALEDTIAFVLRDMYCETTGLFISSLDADSADGEGATYRWTTAQIDTLLGDHAALFHRAYPRFDDHLARNPVTLTTEEEEILRHCRKKLFYARQERAQPGRDEKIMIDANARLMAALATAGWRHDRAAWRAAAARALAQVDTTTLPRHVLNDATAVSLADDAASLALCILTVADWTDTAGMQAAYHAADHLMTLADAAFARDTGGWVSQAKDEEDSFLPVPPLYDAPTPGANGTALRVMTLLAHLSPADDLRWQGQAARLAAALAAPVRDNVAMMASTLAALQFYQNPLLLQADSSFQVFSRGYIPDAAWRRQNTPGLMVCRGTACLATCPDTATARHSIDQALRLGLYKAANS